MSQRTCHLREQTQTISSSASYLALSVIEMLGTCLFVQKNRSFPTILFCAEQTECPEKNTLHSNELTMFPPHLRIKRGLGYDHHGQDKGMTSRLESALLYPTGLQSNQ
jgi:hypothetical protein